ncbi:MAG: cupin domain-containing protein [Myxococcales bacterium]|nr:cupin domain-containing protein [Myxococcales bacterium]
MPLKLPALDPATVTPGTDSSYPEPFRSRVLPREKRALGQALGLRALGVNLTTLHPGAESSMRHWHSGEEEFVDVIEGEVVLRTDGGEQVLTAGMCAGFRACVADAHQVVNRSDRPARYLEVSDQNEEGQAEYPDVDLAYGRGPDGGWRLCHKDGTPYAQ